MKAAVEAIRARDHRTLKGLLASDRKAATKPQVIGEAARLADLASLKLLVAAGADVNSVWRGYRPLHSVIQEEPHAEIGQTPADRLEALAWLLAHGADPELTGAWPPARAVVIAAFVGSQEFVDRLFAHGAKKSAFTAAVMGDVAAVKRELKKDSKLARARDDGGLSALQCCAGSRLSSRDARGRKRSCEIATALLDAGADPNLLTQSWSHEVDVAYFAIGASNRELLELLLERGADATAALSSATWRKKGFELAELCLAHGAAPDRATSSKKPLLNDLVRWGQIDAAEWLLARGASPHVTDEDGCTALHQAASRGNERIAKALLTAGADPKRKDKSGVTPRDVAALARKPKILALFS